MDIIKSIQYEQMKNKVPVLDVGNTVRVHVRIKEGNRERIQVFEGIIIKKQGGGLNETFTVRRISYGVGVEKTFLVHSPLVEKIEVVRVGKARRAKLFYLRDRIGKASKTKEKLGARIENKEIVVKEEMTEENVEEAASVSTEATNETPAETISEVVETEAVVEEAAKEDVAPVEEAKDETTSVEENTETAEEVVKTEVEVATEAANTEPTEEIKTEE